MTVDWMLSVSRGLYVTVFLLGWCPSKVMESSGMKNPWVIGGEIWGGNSPATY